MDSVLIQKECVQSPDGKHVYTHQIKLVSGNYGKCPKAGVHAHEMADQIIIFCHFCKELYKKNRVEDSYDKFMDKTIDKYGDPEKLYKIYGYPDGGKIPDRRKRRGLVGNI